MQICLCVPQISEHWYVCDLNRNDLKLHKKLVEIGPLN
jgi:hypothetical protein